MLTPIESGLSQSDYEALQLKREAYTHQIIAERQNLVFSSFATSGGGSQKDAVILDGYIFHSGGNFGMTIQRVAIADGTVTTVSPSQPTGLVGTSTYALAAASGTLYVFAATATGVQMNSTSNYGSSWAGWSTIWSTSDQTIYTGNVARGGTATASSTYTSSTATYPASNAFDGIFLSEWITPIGTTTGTLQYDLGASVTKIATRYKVTADGTTAPKTWTFQGSNNGSSWTTLDTQTNITGWGSPETKVYSFSNSTAYRYYRLNVTVNNGATQLGVFELTIHETSADEAVILVAAATNLRVHFVYVDGATKTYNLRVVEYISGSWTLTSSTIILTDRPYGLAVATIGTTDFLLLETNVAGRVVDALDGLTLTTNRIKSGGLIVFHYKTDAVTWSAHYVVDILDELSAFQYMRYSHISNLNGTLHVTAFIGSGTEDHPLTGFYDYSSKDGVHWSTRDRLYFGSTQSLYGVKLLQSGEYVYAVEHGAIWRSLSTRYTGYVATSLQEDITRLVDSWTFSQGDLGQFNLTLDNADGYFNDHAFISKLNQVLFTLKFGSFVESEALIYPLGLFEMDSWTVGEGVPEHMVQVTARDFMGRMVDKVKASEFHSYDSYLLGMDNYYAKNSKNYGSLSHLYTVEGQIDPGVGAVTVSNGEAIGFSTFADDIWNGEISCNINTSAANAKAGLVFRSKSKDHFWAFLYNFSTDKVELYRVNSNPGSSGTSEAVNRLYQSSAMSWSGGMPSFGHYLRVRFFYGEIKLYTSTDGISWTLKTTYTMDCSNKQEYDSTYYSDPLTDLDFCERGSVGIYGVGLQNSSFAGIANFQLNNFDLPLTVEDAFQHYASFARIHDQEFNTLLHPGDDMWTNSSGVTVDTGMDTGYYGEDVYDGALYG